MMIETIWLGRTCQSFLQLSWIYLCKVYISPNNNAIFIKRLISSQNYFLNINCFYKKSNSCMCALGSCRLSISLITSIWGKLTKYPTLFGSFCCEWVSLVWHHDSKFCYIGWNLFYPLSVMIRLSNDMAEGTGYCFPFDLDKIMNT